MSKVYENFLAMKELEQEQKWNEMHTMTEQDIEDFYHQHQEEIDNQWQDHIYSNDWGSGEDRIRITDEMFWEFVEERAYEEIA